MFEPHSIRWRAAIFVSAVAGASVASLSSAYANPVTLTDDYYGGINVYNNNPPVSGDVIGPSTIFDITSAAVSLSNNTLSVTINTYFAGAPTNSNLTTDVAGTNYGSLFIGSASTWNADHPSPGPWPGDTFAMHPAEWNYAIVTNGSNANVYSIGNVTSAVLYSGNSGVVQDYNTSAGGKIVMSNVNGDPVTYPNAGNPNFYFRQGQAVQYNPVSETPVESASWSIIPTTYVGASETPLTEGSITYTINDWSALGLGNSIALSWAMTCANDVIQGTVLFDGSNSNPNPTPLPATLPLFVGGLGLLGFSGVGRKRKTVSKIPT